LAIFQQFFEAINPLSGFRDKDEFETYLYDQSNKIEPKEGELQHLKPKHAPEALKSPGIKPPKSSNQFPRSRTVPASAKMAPKSAVTSPVLKSPPLYPAQTTPSSSGTEESHFAIVDISPGGQSRYVGDAGRINQAFEYMAQPFSGGSSSPKSPVLPASTPGGLNSLSRRLPPAPLSTNETRFNFPPSGSGSAFFPLSQPPAVRRRQSEKAPKPVPAQSPNGTFPSKKAPPIPSKSPAFMPKGNISSHYVVDPSEEATQPPVPPRLTEKHLPPPLPTDTLTHLIGSRSPSPRSPTVSLLVPLPPSSSSQQQPHIDATLYDPSEATTPPRPPKSSTLSRNPSSASSSVVLIQTEEELKAPPRPPKSLRSGSTSAGASPNLDPRLNTERLTEVVFDSPPIPPKTKNRLN